MSDNKYKIFRNFMVNELGITREDIREWTMQAVKETVDKELRGIDINSLVHRLARDSINNSYKYGNIQKEVFVEAIYNFIKDKIQLSIQIKEQTHDSEKN